MPRTRLFLVATLSSLALVTAAMSPAPPQVAQVPGAATLAGAVLTAEGKPATAMSIVLFPADDTRWATATPDEIRRATLTNGAYRLPGILPGDYKVAPVADTALAGFPDPELLRRIAAMALPVTLAAGEQTGLSFTVTGSGANVTVVSANLTRTETTGGRGRLFGPGTRVGAPAAPGAISGRVTDTSGRPVANAPIRVLRRLALRGGTAQLVPIGQGTATADDGSYRIGGLSPGPFYVAVVAFAGPSGAAALTRANALPEAPPAADGTPMGFATTYFPGRTVSAQAHTLTVGTTEVAGVDITLAPVPVVDITGQVVTADGAPRGGGFMTLLPEALDDHLGGQNVPRTTVAPDGQFAFQRVPHGRYVLSLNAGPPGWVRLPLDVRGPVEPLALTLQRPFTVSGQIEFAASGRRGQAPFDFSQLTVTLETRPLVAGALRLRATTAPDGTFSFAGVPGGAYTLQATGPAGVTQISGILQELDTLDLPQAIAGDVTDARIVLASRPASLLATVRDDGGQPVPGAVVVVFSDDRRYWNEPSRRVQIVRAPGTSATISDVPPGKYFVVAGYDLSPAAIVSPEWLERLVPRAAVIDVIPGADRTVGVTITSR